jgi:serine/threonine protein kinase
VQPLTFGKYVVQKVIGRGAFGTRYLAVDPNTEQLVHVRVIEAGSRLSREKVESAINETNQLAKLKHPGIATLREFGVDEGSYFIVSDYVEGISLVHWIDQHRTAYDAISGVAAGIADALSYLHRHGVVHREVLTSNILIRADSSPVLLMAGTQNRFIDISSTFMMGSPAYMAPEQLRGQQVDGRADIYSLGVVLYEMLSGRTPYEGGLFEQMKHALQGEPTPPRQFNPSIPLDLECICLRAMAKHPSQRYATAVDLAAELRIRDAASGPMRGDRHDRFDDTDSSPPALTSAPFERVPTASIDAERPVVSSAESPLKPRYRSADRPNIRGTMAPPESEAPSMRRHTWKERTASEPRESSARTRRPWVIIVPIVTAIVLLVAWWCLAK